MTGKNIGFNDELHDMFMRELDDADFELRVVLKSFTDLYPRHVQGAEGRVARNMWGALRALEGVRMAMKEIREKEGGR